MFLCGFVQHALIGIIDFGAFFAVSIIPVSYTHLDVYKRQSIDWSMPCVICIASGFTKYDLHAVNQMQRNIKLVRYQKYGNDLVLFEHLNAPAVPPIPVNNSDFPNSSAIKKSGDQKAHLEKLSAAPRELQDIYHSLCDLSLIHI